MNELKTDILIIGGGLAGLALALALKDSGHSCLLVEQKSQDIKDMTHLDARSIALSPSSRRIFQSLNLWPDIEPYACKIQSIHVSEQGGLARTRLHAKNDIPLGHLVEMHQLHRILMQQVNQDILMAPAECLELDDNRNTCLIQYEHQPQLVHFKLLVAADGSQSRVRQILDLPVRHRHFNQQAIVANIALNRDHEGQAFERFTRHGPIALLPQNGRTMGMVYAMHHQDAQRMMTLNDQDFLANLQKNFGGKLGIFAKIGQRSIWPLVQSHMPVIVHKHIVFIGNAAHTLHPVAGQGFNLALRDVSALAQCIWQQGANTQALNGYQAMREHDHQSILKMTSGLIDVFSSDFLGMSLLRQLGLLAMDNSRLLKQLLSWYAGGFPGPISDLICEIALNEDIT